jgi:hypothetical protein
MIRYIAGLNRSYDYAKVKGADNEDEYQAAMVITRETAPGRSFWITRDAIWKYIEPRDNMEDSTAASDRMEFQKLMDRNQFAQKTAVTPMQRQMCVGEAACIVFAIALNRHSGIMLCTGYNLAQAMQMFDITPVPESAAQLLMWIQDGLDKLKNMPDDPPAKDDMITMGEVTIYNGSQKLGTRDIQVSESELVMESNE